MMPNDIEDPSKLVWGLEKDGFAIARNAVSAKQIEGLRTICKEISNSPTVSRRGNSVYGIRNLLTTAPHIREIVSDTPFIDFANCVSKGFAKPVYGVFFDKPPSANWPVPWHQDVTIRVHERRDIPGFEARPVKDGIVHMQPPVEILEQIVVLRIHLDDATANHGALRVIPGSHRLGILFNQELEQQTANVKATVCEGRAGDVMLMRPLLIHASSACEQPEHRRVIHLEYADFELPGGLQWYG